MPLAALILALDVALVLHAAKTGRFTPWGYIILMLPGIGAAAYVFIELMPAWLGTHQGQKAQSCVLKAINPDKRYRELRDALEVADTIAARAALAEECSATGRHDEAFTLYEGVIQTPMGREPKFVVGKARALLDLGHAADAVQTLDDMRREWPQYDSADAHLLYARALEAAGRGEEALYEFAELAKYYAGAEPALRRARLLRALGRLDESRAAADEMLRAYRRAPRHVKRNQAEWLSEAEKLARG